MEIRQLKTFLSIARTGRFTRAADALGYTQSTVTSHIQGLESELRTRLFERHGRSIRLTSDGERLLPYAERIVNLSDEASALLFRDAEPQGSLVVGAVESLVVFRLASFFQDFLLRYPDISLNLCFGVCSEFPGALRSNTMDVAFLMEVDVQDADLVAYRLWSEPMAFASSPSHPLASLPSISLEDLRDQTLVLSEVGCFYRMKLETVLAEANVAPRTTLAVGQIEIIKQLVRNTTGIAFLPRVVLTHDFEEGTLAELPWKGPEFRIASFLVHHRDKWVSPAMRTFLDAVLVTTAQTER